MATSSFPLPAAASDGFRDAAAYDAYRPTYPPQAVEELLRSLKLEQMYDARVLEIGSGTGKFTELLAAHDNGFEVAAVEPHAPMREQLAAKALRGVDVREGHAEQLPVEDEWADACVVAQAFHWFATPKTLQEIHRALKPGAVLGMIWNIEDYNKPATWEATTAWEQELNDLVFSLPEDGHPRFRHEKWQDVFPHQMHSGPLQVLKATLTANLPLFSLPLGERKLPWTVWLTSEALWSRLRTLSQVAILDGAEKEATRKRFDDILLKPDVEKNAKGEIAVHGHTYLAWSDRL